jgi:hypothetical protein
MRYGLNSCDSGENPTAAPSEYGKESSGFIKGVSNR